MKKNYKKINIKRKIIIDNIIDYETMTCIIPIIKNYVIFKSYGDQINRKGDFGYLIVRIEKVNTNNYYIVDNYHLLLIKDISLYQYIYGFNFKINNFGSTIDLGELKLLNSKQRFQIKNEGLPYDYNSNIKGILIIQFNIKIDNNADTKKILENHFS